MTRTTENLLLIVARAPVAGETKTRLGATTGMERAAMLHRAFLTDLANRFGPIPAEFAGFDFGWAFTPTQSDFPGLIATLQTTPIGPDCLFIPQIDGTFGERLTALIKWGIDAGYRRVALMASDSPHLSVGLIGQAFACLLTSDLVIGRVHDGGYYLVGLRSPSDILAETPMGGDDAAQALVQEALRRGMSVAEIAPTFDVDREADLDPLIAEADRYPENIPATARALTDMGLRDSRARNDRAAP